MKQERKYLEALREIEAAVRAAEPELDIVIEGAAGLLAGRIEGDIDQARGWIMRRAAEQGRPPGEVAAEIRTVLQGPGAARPADEFLRAAAGPAPRGDRAFPSLTIAGTPAEHIVQQMLDADPGRHLFLQPVAGDAGEVTDYRVAAASPSVTDLSGRSGAQLVGCTLAELYPWLVDGPIWQAWARVVADGRPRTVGPLPYRAGSGPEAVTLTITAQGWPVGGGVLATWTRRDEQRAWRSGSARRNGWAIWAGANGIWSTTSPAGPTACTGSSNATPPRGRWRVGRSRPGRCPPISPYCARPRRASAAVRPSMC